MLKHESRHRLLFAVVGQRFFDIEIRQRVTRHDNKRVVFEILFRFFDAACCSKRRVFHRVDEIDAKLRAVAEVAFDFVGEIIECHDNIRDAVALQQLNRVLHTGLVPSRSPL